MKKVTLLIAIMLISVSAFAVDFSASTYMTGDLWGTNGLKLANTSQTDADLLQVSISDELWGSSFRLNTLAADNSPVLARKIAIWVKPLPILKLTVGKIGSGLYTEQLNWWQVPDAGAAVGFDGDSATSGYGMTAEITADSLWILAGISPGIGNNLMAANLAVGADTDFGVAAKYTIAGFGSVGASFHYKGATGTVIEPINFRVGMDINAVAGLYAFVQAICRMDAGTSLDGIAFDDYIAYTAGDFYIKANIPFILRLAAGSNSYLTYDVKTGYTVMPNFTPFFRIQQQDAASYIDFTNVVFNPTINFGADYSIGKVSFVTSVQINVPAAGGTLTWAIPFEMRASW